MPESAPHILVVDDEPAVREALATGLGLDYVVHVASNGTEACDCLRASPMAAIILDAILEEGNGLDLVAQFRTLSPARILLLTGHSSEDLAIRAVRTHVDDYLTKPVSLPALHAALERLLPPGGGAALAGQARRYLDEHWATRVCFADLAAQLGVSEAHLRRIFRDAYGTTPHRYLNHLRMREAASLLRSSTLGVEQIALRVGCLSVPWFNKRFKRTYAVTPSEYRAARNPHETAPGPIGAPGET